jgi:uncharacterized protein (DUF1684 family)
MPARTQHRSRTAWVVILPLIAATLAGACNRDAGPPPISDADYQAAYQKFLAVRSAQLVTAGKPVSFTGLHWLKQGVSSIGSDSTSGVVLVGHNVPANIGTLTRDGMTVRFDPLPGAGVMVDSAPATARVLVSDSATKPSKVTIGSAGFWIVKRVDSIGVRTWDADRPAIQAFAPLEYFKTDMAWRLGAKFTKRAKPDTQAVATSLGVAEEYIDVGRLALKVDGKPYDMVAYAGNDPTDLFITFSDVTSGEETYGFRFMHAVLDTMTNVATVDFNKAFNPDCAFSAYTTCPLPPANNRLATRVEAGEKVLKHSADAKP